MKAYWEDLGVQKVTKNKDGITSYGLKVGDKYILEPKYKSISEPEGENNWCTGVFTVAKDSLGRCTLFIFKEAPITEKTRMKEISITEEYPKIVNVQYFGKGLFLLKDVAENVLFRFQYNGYWG